MVAERHCAEASTLRDVSKIQKEIECGVKSIGGEDVGTRMASDDNANAMLCLPNSAQSRSDMGIDGPSMCIIKDVDRLKSESLNGDTGMTGFRQDTTRLEDIQVSEQRKGICPEGLPSYGTMGTLGGGVSDLEPLSPKVDKNAAWKKVEDFSFRNTTTRNKLTLVSMALVNFGTCAAYAVLAPFFPTKAAQKDLTQTQIGVIFGLYGLVIFLTAPVLGGMISRIGAKAMFLSGIFLSGTCQILFGTLQILPNGTVFFAMCFLIRTLEALGSCAEVVASFAIIAHEFPNNVATVFGSLQIFTGFGFMVGPPLGGALYQWGGYGLPFYTLGGLLVICGLVCSWTLTIKSDNSTAVEGSTLSLFLKPSACVITMSVVIEAMAFGFLEASLADHLTKFGLSPFLIGWLFFVMPASYALSAPLWGWIGDKKGHVVAMVVVGNFLSAIPYVLIGPVPFLNVSLQLWLVIVSLVLAGMFMGCCFVPTVKALIDIARANGYPENFQTYGLVSGLFNSAVYCGQFLGPIIMGGIVVDSIGFEWAAGICSLCFITVGIVTAAQRGISGYLLRNSISFTSKGNQDSG